MTVPDRMQSQALSEQQEDLANLQIGPEFGNAQSLTISEAKILIEAVLNQRNQEANDESPLSETTRKVMNYLDLFARYTSRESAYAVERLLSSVLKLRPVERALLGSLGCGEAEEAKTLIPRLADRIDDTQLQDILDQLANLQKY